MTNWKTTTFGLMTAIGAAITAAIRIGILDGSKMPDWVNVVAGLLTVVGSAALGFFAKDGGGQASGVRGQESGTPGTPAAAGPPANPPKP